MTGIVTPDPSIPLIGGSPCGDEEIHGLVLNVYQCSSGNGVYYRIVCSGIEVDINPTRVLVTNGTTQFEIDGNQISMTALNIIVNGELQVNGGVAATGDVVAGTISVQKHRHPYLNGSVNSNTGAAEM